MSDKGAEMPNLAIISRHEKGFWQADFYFDADPEMLRLTGQSPDDFKTFSVGGSETEAREWVSANWPTATILCGEEYEEDEWALAEGPAW